LSLLQNDSALDSKPDTTSFAAKERWKSAAVETERSPEEAKAPSETALSAKLLSRTHHEDKETLRRKTMLARHPYEDTKELPWKRRSLTFQQIYARFTRI